MTASEWIKRHRGKLVVALLLIGGIVYLYQVHGDQLNRELLVEYGKSVPTGWFIAAFFILPLLGFPISLLLVLAGIRFGLGWGVAIAAGGMGFHHIAAYRIAHGLFRDRMRGWLDRAGHAIPPIKAEHRAWFTALFAAVHGPPYTAKLYLLALTDIPFKVYFWAGAPVYILFALLPLAAGNAVMDLDPVWVSAILVGFIVLLVVGRWLARKFGRTGA